MTLTLLMRTFTVLVVAAVPENGWPAGASHARKVGRIRGAHDVYRVVVAIPYDGAPRGVNGSSQKSGVQKRGAGGVQFTNEGRPCIRFAGGLIGMGHRKIRRNGKSSHIDIAGRVKRQGL